MARPIEKLAEEAANLEPAQFAEFLRRVAQERSKRRVPIVDDELVRQEDLVLSERALAEDWQSVPDDWEAGGCPSSEAT